MSLAQHGSKSHYEGESRTKFHKGIIEALSCLLEERWFICNVSMFHLNFYCNFMKIKSETGCGIDMATHLHTWLLKTHSLHSTCYCSFVTPCNDDSMCVSFTFSQFLPSFLSLLNINDRAQELLIVCNCVHLVSSVNHIIRSVHSLFS